VWQFSLVLEFLVNYKFLRLVLETALAIPAISKSDRFLHSVLETTSEIPVVPETTLVLVVLETKLIFALPESMHLALPESIHLALLESLQVLATKVVPGALATEQVLVVHAIVLVPEVLETTLVPEVLVTAQVQEVLETTQVQEVLETTQAPEVLETTQAPEVLETTQAPEVLVTTQVSDVLVSALQVREMRFVVPATWVRDSTLWVQAREIVVFGIPLVRILQYPVVGISTPAAGKRRVEFLWGDCMSDVPTTHRFAVAEILTTRKLHSIRRRWKQETPAPFHRRRLYPNPWFVFFRRC
jgi:hypothetical protein